MIKTSLHKQQGLTLIELMISMTLGLFVVFAVGSILVTSNKTASISSTLSDSQDTGRFTVSYITRQILRAGFNPSQDRNAPKLTAFPPICTADPNDVMCLSNSDDSDAGDRIAIRRTAEAGSDNAVTCSGSRLQASGADIATDAIVVDAFWVGPDSNNRLNLRCQTYDADGTTLGVAGTAFSTAESLAMGVVGMQVLYGESNNPPEDQIFSVNRYVSADNVTDWDNVYAIRLAIITESLSSTQALASEKIYSLLDANQYTYNDQTLRQVFTTTITLLNLARGEE